MNYNFSKAFLRFWENYNSLQEKNDPCVSAAEFACLADKNKLFDRIKLQMAYNHEITGL
jgi:hypothetical protein